MPNKVSFLLNSQNQMKQLCSLVARLRDVTFSVGCKIARCDVVLPLTERSLVIERFFSRSISTGKRSPRVQITSR